MGCLYTLIFPNGKRYIGITTKSAEERWLGHIEAAREGRKYAVSSAIRKYGPQSVQVVTLVIADDWDYLSALEVRAIALYKTRVPEGYNITEGGRGASGLVHSPEMRRECARKTKLAMQRPEIKKKVQAAAEARAANPEWRAKIGASSKGRKQPPRTPAWRAMVVEMRKREWADPAMRERRLAILARARETRRALKENNL